MIIRLKHLLSKLTIILTKMFPLEHNSCVNTSKDFASSKSLNLSTRKEQKTSGSLFLCSQSGVKPQRYDLDCHEYYKKHKSHVMSRG